MSNEKLTNEETPAMNKHEKKKEETTQEAKIAFQDWFVMTLKSNKKVEPHHYDTLLTFAKTQKLTESEPSYKYDEALKKFGF